MNAKLLWDHLAEFFWVGLAVFGGIAKSLDPFLKDGTRPVLSEIAIRATVSGFSGYLTAQAVSLIYPDWAIVAAGVGGYAGTESLSFFIDLCKKRIRLLTGEEKV